MRLFVALELDEALRAAATETQGRLLAELGAAAKALKPVRPEAFHFTLKFIGEVDDATALRVSEAAAEAARTLGPFTLALAGAGCFPTPKRPRVFWMGASGELDAASTLARAVGEALAARHVDFDDKAFKPHLTLARVGDAVRADVPAVLARLAGERSPPQLFGVVSVMRSQLSPHGSRYEAVSTHTLVAP